MTVTTMKVESARDLGPQFVDNPHRMVGQDGAYSIPLGGGESFWFFGDTLIGKRVPGESLWYPGGERIGPEDMSGKRSIDRMITNTALIFQQQTGKDGLKDYRYLCDERGELLQLVPHLPDEHRDRVRIWCLHGCRIEGRFYLYYVKVTMRAEGPLPVNFDVNGSGLAVGSERDWCFRRIEHNGETLFWGEADPKFGTTVLLDESDGYAYVYGVSKDSEGRQHCYISRVRWADIEDPTAYEYLVSDEPHWSADVGGARSIFGSVPNEMSVSYNPYLGCYLAVHSLDLTGEIVGRTAPRPWGPWSEPVTLWTVHLEYEKPPPYPPLIYAGKEHPEIDGEDGRVLYITYIEFEEYFPHLVEVTLA